MSDQATKLVDWLIRAAAALIPILLAALVSIAWTNSNRIAVLARDVEDLDHDIKRMRDLIDNKLISPSSK